MNKITDTRCANCRILFKKRRPGVDRTTCSLKCRKEYFVGKKAVRYKHGGHLENKHEFNSWRAMRERCTNPNYRAYERYGGRGITIDPRWLGSDGFINFLSDMGKKPGPKYSIDRIDNNGNYTPKNCRWSNQTTQVNNSTNVRKVVIDGVEKTIGKWIEEYDVSLFTYYSRRRSGMTVIEALSTPIDAKKRVNGIAGARARYGTVK